MGIIQQLPDYIANQIAAGEVIQRPASVVKELVENAIDAEASEVKILIKDAGRTLIQVIDNGKGMSEDDAVNCFLRHATSKIKSASDLYSLQTKGFRGEALASIAAIAHVQLTTKHTENEAIGIQLNLEGGQINDKKEVVCSNGSSFDVKNLFYNVPARRNFLKSDSIEFGHIRDEFERIALAHPEIRFLLMHNGNEIHNLPSANTRKRIVDLFGRNTNEQLVPIEELTNIVKVSGFIGKPDKAKKSRGEQFLFVNNRFFKDGYFHHAISKAYEGLIPDKYYPSYFIFFEIDPSKIDVNVHPTKTEIKFEEDRFVYSILTSSVRQALGKYNVFPTLDFERDTAFDLPSDFRKNDPVEPQIKVNPLYNPFENQQGKSSGSGGNGFSKGLNKQGFGQVQQTITNWEEFYKIQELTGDEQLTLPEIEESNFSKDTTQLLFHGNYIVSPCKSGLMVIHFRRAYERILYTDIASKFIHSPLSSQSLLFPITISLHRKDLDFWNANVSLFKQLGFSGTIDNLELNIEGIPSFLSAEDTTVLIEELLKTAGQKDIEKIDVATKFIEKIAKISSRSKKIDTQEAAQHLIEELFQCEEHQYTTDGKRIVSTLAFSEIDLKF
ncbi:MAG TPA: DNA mismatch repair endonuclease MutL [Crocinitomicaceae bacterium]|nr:DNA mismatch repair endonuclease MutL [Flavobacteriales bacterium]HBW85943.1 DNA mismatch repair endonuclease MutL [Crocinitomicaceae bacterium]